MGDIFLDYFVEEIEENITVYYICETFYKLTLLLSRPTVFCITILFIHLIALNCLEAIMLTFVILI